MALVRLSGVSVGFGAAPLLDGVEFQIERGERVCLVGRNGSGKSTLLRVIAGELEVDDGVVQRMPELRVGTLPQEVPAGMGGKVFAVAASGLGELGELLARHQTLSQRLASGDQGCLDELDRVQQALEATGGWALGPRVEQVLSRLQLDPGQDFSSLSGGLKRRVLLARALVTEPDLLILDEPTNHLDIDAITWLEEFLLAYPGALLFVSHDRRFLQRLATRIVELDRGRLRSYPGDYQTYLDRKAAELEVESVHNALFDKRLAQEEAWLRQGIKARRTRNEGRVRALMAMREERRRRREQLGTAKIGLQEAERSGRLVVEAENIRYGIGNRLLIKDFSTTILRGDKIGIVGPNGAGKTTLIRLLLGELQPDAGRIRRGTRLEVAYFDQLRDQLDEEASVLDNVAEGSDRVLVNGKPKHIIGYLRDFLFTPERARTPVKALSGGERARLLLAKLFTRPANLLVLDEPTNDLDVETLELLEGLLVEFAGTVLLVSHDRAFLDNVCTNIIAFEGDGVVRDYVGGYQDWQRQRPAAAPAPRPPTQAKASTRKQAVRPKLSYREQRELEALPQRIEQLEQAIGQLQRQLADPELYRQRPDEVAQATARLEALEQELEQAFERWEALEALKG
ncbi:MAG: ATP-binding cassette domain-containing protein [Xanthomonadaceae bacterium]|nr:ATP-binding cassette domain-containing protein [Xanthomonadaceae bacterium]